MMRKLPHVPTSRASLRHEIDDELRFHLDARTEELIQRGHTAEDARRIALEEYGDVSAARAELAAIDKRRLGKVAFREWFESVTQDVRFGLRGLAKRPLFTATVLITLALGIGANAAIFNVVNGVLLRALPYDEPERLVHLWETFESRVASRSEASYPDYLDFRARAKSFTDLAGYQGSTNVLGVAEPATIRTATVTANFFSVLGVVPVLGRSFLPGEDAVGAPRIALLTYGTWQRRFAGDRAIVGKSITLDGVPAMVIGVLPESFRFARASDAELWTPIARPQTTRDNRGNHWLNVVARLRPGITRAQAAADMAAVMRRLAEEYPNTNTGRTSQVVPLSEEMVGSVRPILLVLYSAVIVVLLVACVNVATLLLIRGADRQREMAVRIALGAGRGRIVRQLLTESLVLAIGGGLLGLVVARFGASALMSLIPAQQMRGLGALTATEMDWRIAAYAMAVALLAGLGFGMVPAFRLTRSSLAASMKSGSKGSMEGGRLRDALVASEVALTTVLLCGALLFGRSLLRLMTIDPGFRAEQAVTTTVSLPSRSFDGAAQQQYYGRLLSALRDIPGVASVGMTSKMPLDAGNSTSFDVVGRPPSKPGSAPDANHRGVVGDYFAALSIPLLAGRAFDPSDASETAPHVIVVNRALAEGYFANGAAAIGQSLIFAADTFRIVGVVGTVPVGRIEEKPIPTVFVPFYWFPQSTMAVVIRSSRDVAQLAPLVRRAVLSTDPNAAMTAVKPVSDLVTESPSVFMRRFPLFLIGAFAATALVLAIVGIYGVVSYAVAQRTREMGIRVALGAQSSSLTGLVMSHAVRIALVGIVIGLVLARFAGRFAGSLLYDVRPGDPLTYGLVALVLGTVAVLATVLPARRATRVDPALALRSE
jgi:predicted permease